MHKQDVLRWIVLIFGSILSGYTALGTDASELLAGAGGLSSEIQSPDRPTREQADAALRKAVAFFREQVSVQGGYLWQYSGDLKLREGEAVADASTAWVQPPGTPKVGTAFLGAYRLTGQPYLLEAATETAEALVHGQLQSGGWDYRIEFDPNRRRKYAYRAAGGTDGGRNTSTLDDNTTQAALQFLMQVDLELEFKQPAIHEAVQFGLAALLRVQYPNGAWPQRFVEPSDPAGFPVQKAGYPETWSRIFPKRAYSSDYTFNDNTIADTIGTMLEAARIYGDPRYQAAAEQAGDFIILAQMPEPQPAWAQQYDQNMQPTWARRFEPPAVTGGESQGVMRVLMTLYKNTGKRKYLEPIPRAIEYLIRSRLPDGRLARFYELKTNQPLYFTKQYELTYDNGDMPTHYAFIVGSALDSIQDAYERLAAADYQPPKVSSKKPTVRLSSKLTQKAQAVIQQLDSRGAWMDEGQMKYQDGPDSNHIIRCSTFSENVAILSQFIAAK